MLLARVTHGIMELIMWGGGRVMTSIHFSLYRGEVQGMIWWMTQHDLSLGEIMRIYPSEVADTSLTAVRFCNVMVIMQSVSDAASWWDEVALVIYPSRCVLGNKTWLHNITHLWWLWEPNRPITAMTQRLSIQGCHATAVPSVRCLVVDPGWFPQELQAASTRHESSGVSVLNSPASKNVDVDILQQLRFIPMDIENWSSIVVICCVRQGVSSQDSCFAFTFFCVNSTKPPNGSPWKKKQLQQRPNLKTFTLALRSCAKGLINMNMVGQRMMWKIAVVPVKNPQD